MTIRTAEQASSVYTGKKVVDPRLGARTLAVPPRDPSHLSPKPPGVAHGRSRHEFADACPRAGPGLDIAAEHPEQIILRDREPGLRRGAGQG
jgi:hypothetical protein